MEIKQIIQNVRENNPYPVYLFPEPSDEDWKGIGQFLLSHGKNSDLIFGKWGRQVWENCVRCLEDHLPTYNLSHADLKFIIFHRPTGTEIQMPVLNISEEYSSLMFSTSEKDYSGKYNGIKRLPTCHADDTADEYDVYVEINGVRFIYDGLFYKSNGTEGKRE